MASLHAEIRAAEQEATRWLEKYRAQFYLENKRAANRYWKEYMKAVIKLAALRRLKGA